MLRVPIVQFRLVCVYRVIYSIFFMMKSNVNIRLYESIFCDVKICIIDFFVVKILRIKVQHRIIAV